MSFSLAGWVALFGAIATLLASVLKESKWSADVKRYIALGTSIAMGFVATYTAGVTDPGNVGLVVSAVIGASQAYYALITGPLGLDTKIANAIPSPFRLIFLPFTLRAAKEKPITKADVDQAVQTAVGLAVDRFSAMMAPPAVTIINSAGKLTPNVQGTKIDPALPVGTPPTALTYTPPAPSASEHPNI